MANGNLRPKVYLDANIVISFIETQDDSICELIKLCNKNKIKMYISPFTMMESLDIKQEHKYFNKKVVEGVPLKSIISNRYKRDLSKDELQKIHEKIKRKLNLQDLGWYFYPLDPNWWKTALDIVADSNVTSSDALHLGQALNMDVQLLITNDNEFKVEGNKYLIEVSKGKIIEFIVSTKKALEIIKKDFESN